MDFFTSDLLKETISNISKGKTDVNLKTIINGAIENIHKDKPEK